MPAKRWTRLSATLTVAAAIAAIAPAPSSAVTLNGEGSTLIAPLESVWATSFAGANQAVYPGLITNFNADGSAKGFQAIATGSVDFGASDAPLSAFQGRCGHCVQIPWALSATGVGIHVRGLKVVRLTGAIIGRIYTGQITNWADPAIQRLNDHRMPNLHITPVFRTDGSGDTYAFTRYESETSPVFRSRIGVGTQRKFVAGVGVHGSDGMIRQLQSTDGAIAYVAVTYLASDWPRVAAIQNRAGRFTVPNFDSILDAGLSVTRVPRNNELNILDPAPSYANAYVISTFTYVIVPTNAAQGALLRAFIGFAIGDQGQSYAPGLDFVPLTNISPLVLQADQNTLNTIS